MANTIELNAEAEPLTPWEQLKQSFHESRERANARQARRATLRREARHFSTPAIEMQLNSIEQDVIALLQTRHDAQQREVSEDAVAAVFDDWRTVRRVLDQRRR